MQLTKQQKMLVGVLGLGLGALVVDRLVLGPPEQAAADQSTVSDAALPEGAPASVGPEAHEPEAAALPSFSTLTERLAQSAGHGPAGQAANDPFRLPEDWRVSEAPVLPRADTDESGSAQVLLDRYRLSATQTNGDVKFAVVNGKILKVDAVVRIGENDQTVAYRLVQIDDRQVIWETVQADTQARKLVVMKIVDPDRLR